MTTTQTQRARRPTTRDTRPHRPCSSAGCEPYVGRNGQNATRPTSVRIAGSRVSMASSAAAIPIEPTGPRPWLDFRSDSSRHISATMTVPPLATIGANAARQATFIASKRLGYRRSSSRYRETSSSA